MFGEVITKVVLAWLPVYDELALSHPVFHPIKTHVHCFGSALFDSVVGDAGGDLVVSGDWSGGLRVAEFFEGGAEWHGVLAVVEEGGSFGFGDRGANNLEDGGKDMDGTICGWLLVRVGFGVGAEEKISSHA